MAGEIFTLWIYCWCSGSSFEQKYFSYLESEASRLVEKLRTADLVVGFSVKKFNYAVLQPYADFDLSEIVTFDMLDYIKVKLNRRQGSTAISGQEYGQYMIYPSDRYGFNNPDSEWDAPQTEWVLTGDSYAYGHAVQNGEDIAGQIRSITQENVINLGMGGNGPLIELAALKEYAESRKPKIVLWVYFENDPIAFKEESKSAYSPNTRTA